MAHRPPPAQTPAARSGPARRAPWRRVGLLVPLVAVTILVVLPALPAPATTTQDQPTDGPRLVLTGLEAVVGPSEEFVPESEPSNRLPSSLTSRVLVENPGDTRLEGVDLVVEVYGQLGTRPGLRAALDGPGPGGVGRVVLDRPLDPVPAGGIVQLDLEVDAAEAGLLSPDDDVAVHPVVISLVREFDVIDEVRTAAVGVSRTVAEPLETVLVLPLDGPAPGTDGQAQATADTLLPGGRLDRLLRAAETAPPGTVTVAPASHVAEDLTSLVDATAPGATDMLDRLRAVSVEQAATTISAPYALADVPALAATEGTAELASAAIVAGRQRLLDLVGTAPSAAHLVIAPQTDAGLDLAPTDVLVAPWEAGQGPDLTEAPSTDIPPALRRTRSASGRTLDVLVGDPWVARQLRDADGRHGWAVAAHRVVAESAMTFAEAPSRAGRAFAVLPPTGWEAPGRLADEVYARLARAPWLRPTDPFAAAARTRQVAPLEVSPSIPIGRTALLGRVSLLQDELDGLASAVVEVEEQPAVVERGDDLLRGVSTWPDAGGNRAQRILTTLEEGIDEAVGEVVVPGDSVVTLASERGVIPVTIQHPEGVPMDVVVEVAAQGRLAFDPDQGTTRPVRLERGGTATVSFEARALGRGEFPVQVTVRTPTGDVVLARQVVAVRASVVSRPALIAIGGVVLVLLVAGRLRSRRSREPDLQVVR